MITKAQALTVDAFHLNGCHRTVGPRGGEEVQIYIWLRNGRTQTWKTRPTEFRIPVKFGLYAKGQIWHSNASEFHVPEDCPVLKEQTGLQLLRQQWEQQPTEVR